MQGDAPFLSIIVPFHNSAEACPPLLRTLSTLAAKDRVELIFIDDGSTDDTLRILLDFTRTSRAPVQVLEQENRGPGAARNAGLDRASGAWLWFVDSDDAIDLGAIERVRSSGWPDMDAIVWNFRHPDINRRIAPGVHDTSARPAPALDPVVANWFSAAFLRRTGLRFPEYCIYEATPLEAFVLPLLVSRYVVSDFTAYHVTTGGGSVTRGARSARFYDRLRTVSLGMRYVADAQLEPQARSEFEAAFVRLFLWYSIRLAKLPGPSWVSAARVMRAFREEARRLGVSERPFDHYPGRSASRLVLRLLWLLSHALPSQDQFLQRQRERAWGREVEWNPPTLPARWARSPGAIQRPRVEADRGSCL